MQNRVAPMRAWTRVASGVLQRSCGCGQHTIAGGECEGCRKKGAGLLQRAAVNSVPSPDAPPIVHDVLNSPGQSLDSTTRDFFEPRFRRGFSDVRVHADSQAAESARAVAAEAYTVGSHIVFDLGRYQPESSTGRQLVAHELAHVAQQNDAPGNKANNLKIGGPNDSAEQEADHVSEEIIADRPVTVALNQQRAVRRKIKADRPNTVAPGPAPAGQQAQQTRGEVVEDYLRHLSTGGSPAVDRTSGDVSIGGEFCRKRGVFERVGRGIVSGAKTGASIGVYALGVGAIPGAILGGLIGGIAGIFGSDSQAEESSTPTGSTCLCDLVNSDNTWTIHVHDFPTPVNIEGANVTWPVTSNLDRQARKGFVVVPTPNSPQTFGGAMAGGQLANYEPWVVLGHELCGHAWLQDRSSGGDEEESVRGEDLRHHRSVERENLIRAEHHMEERGFRIKDPYCGESFSRPRNAPESPAQFGPSQEGLQGTRLEDCQQAREKFFPEQARRFRVDQRIP